MGIHKRERISYNLGVKRTSPPAQPFREMRNPDDFGTFSVDLSADGLPAVPLLYRSGYRVTREPTPLHVHPGCTELVLCLRGCLTFETRTDSCEVRPGELLVIPEEQHHRLYTTRKGVASCGLCFRNTAVEPVLRQRFAHIPQTPLPQRPDTRRALLKLIDVHRSWPADPLKTLALKTSFHALLFAVLESAHTASEQTMETTCIQTLVAEIRRDPVTRRTVADLARRVHVSESLLTSAFCRTTGYPPHAFMVRERLKTALRFLRTPHITLGGVALQLGYSSQQHFSAQFTRYCGVTPRAYRAGADASL